ncbi:hypothetical protein CGMCC3_g10541 [Colletotrichum fructicola]|nr:uncharacterized protein CGMCC3_g10541 [Colletotrichum fructicola]KAE9573160.1 hypothetical protein CGMCC3_g10541 [Colletotrichum fructicola]
MLCSLPQIRSAHLRFGPLGLVGTRKLHEIPSRMQSRHCAPGLCAPSSKWHFLLRARHASQALLAKLALLLGPTTATTAAAAGVSGVLLLSLLLLLRAVDDTDVDRRML